MCGIPAIALGVCGGLSVSDVGHAQFRPQLQTSAVQNVVRGRPGVQQPITAIQKGGQRSNSDARPDGARFYAGRFIFR